MYALMVVVFLVSTIMADGDIKMGMAIAAGLFAVADAISQFPTNTYCSSNNKNKH